MDLEIRPEQTPKSDSISCYTRGRIIRIEMSDEKIKFFTPSGVEPTYFCEYLRRLGAGNAVIDERNHARPHYFILSTYVLKVMSIHITVINTGTEF
jgi:hypothetical protein